MEIPVLQTAGDEFDDRNVVLYLALGAISCSRRLDRILERAEREESRGHSPGDDSLVLALLGLIALRNRLISACEEAASSEKPLRRSAGREDSSVEVSTVSGLLR